MKALGVTDHRFLGGSGTYRDSGMEWDETATPRPTTIRDDTFWRADLTEAADHLVAIIREVRPQVIVTYDEFGNYGHPDHVQAHRVATYGAQLAAVPSYRPTSGSRGTSPKIYWAAMSISGSARSRGDDGEGGENPFEGMDLDNPRRASSRPDEAIAAVVDGTDYADAKIAAMQAHRDPDRRRRPVLRAVQQRRQPRLGHRVLPAGQGHAGARSTSAAGRPTSSPGCEPTGPLAGLARLPVGAVTGIASLAVHDKSWAWFLLAVAAPVVTVVALPEGWPRVGFGFGWVGMLMVALVGRPDGDDVARRRPAATHWAASGWGLLMLVIVTVPVNRRTGPPG